MYLDTYKEAATKERELFYSASASEPEFTSNLKKTPLLQQKRTYNKTIQDDSDSCKFNKHLYKIFHGFIIINHNTYLKNINNNHTNLFNLFIININH